MFFSLSAEFSNWKTVEEREDMRKTNGVELFVTYLFLNKRMQTQLGKPLCNILNAVSF